MLLTNISARLKNFIFTKNKAMNWSPLLSPQRLRQTTRQQSDLDRRNEFESDYGRIVFSPALRRMHDKTQVFPLTSDDNVHTRLTHSMEVAALANSLGINLCSNKEFIKHVKFDEKDDLVRIIPSILSSVSLCHDIGNPPFGHFGEEVIAKYFEDYFKSNDVGLSDEQKLDFTKYNGNAQGFRVLTKQQILQDRNGLNLTVGTLSSFLKYPRLSGELGNDGYHKKLGVFQSEKEVVEWIRHETGLDKIRHPLAFLMEAADTISYQVMDIEDGFNMGLYRNSDIYDFMISNGNQEVQKYFTDFIADKYSKLEDFNKERTAIVNLRIALISRQVNHAVDKFISKSKDIHDGRYANELVFDDSKGGMAATLKMFIEQNIFVRREIQSLELTGCSVIRGLLDHFIPELINEPGSKRSDKLWNMISHSLRNLIEIETGTKDLNKISNYYKLRIIVDYISGMTDKYALSLYQRLLGIRID